MLTQPVGSGPSLPLSLFERVALSVVLADGDDVASLREGSTPRSITLLPPYHVSETDTYLVVPADLGTDLVDIFADGDLDLVHATVQESVLVSGDVERKGRGVMSLYAEHAVTVADALVAGLAHGATVRLGGLGDPLRVLNRMPHVRVTMLSALLDQDGLASALGAEQFAGAGWRVPRDAAAELRSIAPTYVWSRRTAEGVGIELALFSEDDELVALVRPAMLIP
ncbi:MAG: hypothetical protein IT379_22090 [Deltaproteobacteria bacterium]|nr:hypothetical protein [Deltaproteobacteria bacterium]